MDVTIFNPEDSLLAESPSKFDHELDDFCHDAEAWFLVREVRRPAGYREARQVRIVDPYAEAFGGRVVALNRLHNAIGIVCGYYAELSRYPGLGDLRSKAHLHVL